LALFAVMGAKLYELASVELWIVAFVMAERDDAPESFTVIVTSSLLLSKLSFAVRRNTYVPLCEKVAVVSTAFALPNVTLPSPLTMVQVVVTLAGGFGSRSSVTVPSKFAEAGNVNV
jgi:hypothetical protein